MAYRDKNHRFIKSFRYAFEGIIYTIKHERNIKVQLGVAMIVIGAGLFFRISVMEWLILVLCIASVLALELMNSAVEKTVDLVTTEQHPLAKLAKDMAAGSVLVFTIGTVILGTIIFLPKIIDWIAL